MNLRKDHYRLSLTRKPLRIVSSAWGGSVLNDVLIGPTCADTICFYNTLVLPVRLFSMKDENKTREQLLTVDLLARASMKNVASCDK